MTTQQQREFHNKSVRLFRQQEIEHSARWDQEQDFWYFLVCPCGRHHIEPSSFAVREMRGALTCKMCGRRWGESKTEKMPKQLLLVWDEIEVPV